MDDLVEILILEDPKQRVVTSLKAQAQNMLLKKHATQHQQANIKL